MLRGLLRRRDAGKALRPAKMRRWSCLASATSRSSRTSTMASRRWPTASSRSRGVGQRARDARAAARLHGPRARARHHDQGAGRARAVDRTRASEYELNLIDTPGHVDFTLRGVALAGRLRGCAAGRRRRAGHRGADARQRPPRARERPRDRAVLNKIDLPAADPDGGRRSRCGLPRRPARRRAAHLGQDGRRRRRGARRDRRARAAARGRPRRAAARARLRLARTTSTAASSRSCASSTARSSAGDRQRA